jgi:hypothetical protein
LDGPPVDGWVDGPLTPVVVDDQARPLVGADPVDPSDEAGGRGHQVDRDVDAGGAQRLDDVLPRRAVVAEHLHRSAAADRASRIMPSSTTGASTDGPDPGGATGSPRSGGRQPLPVDPVLEPVVVVGVQQAPPTEAGPGPRLAEFPAPLRHEGVEGDAEEPGDGPAAGRVEAR